MQLFAIIDPSIDPTCRLCGEDNEDSEHIIAECDALWKERLESFGKVQLDTPIPWTPAELMNFLKIDRIKELENDDIENGDTSENNSDEDVETETEDLGNADAEA